MGFFYSQFFVRPPYPTRDFSNETVIVTGANTGLGFEASKHFARLNAKVILACRNLEAGQKAKESIEQSTQKKNCCEVWSLDLSDYGSVKEFAERASTLERVDHLVENAGIHTSTYKEIGGEESTVLVNVISTFLLALLMLPVLQRTADKFKTRPTLTIVASEVHAWAKFPERNLPQGQILASLSDMKTATMKERYLTSKLLEVLIVREISPLVSKSSNSSVVLNMLNPGFCHSELNRELAGWIEAAVKLVLARSTEMGSRTHVAAASAGPDSHGKYMTDGAVNDDALATWVKQTEGQEVGAKVWAELKEKLETISPGVLKCLDPAT
eukprot:Protomagalhaensia_wolfi_Nauph_80__1339@NODE_179_length_3278_cov_264_687249_g135_i0_p1_GENE_NODE_179_length_3278_cov_264_687249_g135_i0NODE_179_length_3278_cov_264_687249_g135_i0_p1_ORF_typecomplete_len327_score64_83adh_short/PF00106_25/7_7e31adh_short_C2/PF13561_6/3_5e15KR/PF08659_10/3_1e09Epimerase/PF01370_21/0_00019Sacchrp_dh_NADP/PF03435_18/0_0022Sacchrp_dh_NADP/PF03435_18/6e03RmlD_sub_bind/PF04321_17/0_0513Beta_HSD/PF01073_19/0_11_NODE_179_length_3278_cov_264_687249_g135_i022273207